MSSVTGEFDTVIYCRISLDAAGDRLGVERQEKECRQFCDRNGWPVSVVLVDNDLSATTGVTRPEFEKLLKLEPRRVVVWHLDRLVRRTSDLERVIDKGFPVHAVTAGNLDLSTPSGRAVARTVSAWSQYEGEQKSLRQKASHRQRAEQGRPFWTHRRPFGYEVDGTLHETEAPALRECYRMYREGETFASCARWLSSQGFKTTQGNTWDGLRLARTMRDLRNGGISCYNKEEVGRGIWEPIVPEDELRAVLARAVVLPKSSQPQGKRVQSLLGGIARCAECGEPARQTRQQKVLASGEKRYRRIYQPHCHHVSIQADWLDDYVAQHLFRIAQSPAWALRMGNETDEKEASEAARGAVEARKKLDELLDLFASGEIDVASYKRAKGLAETRLAGLENKARSYYASNPLLLTLGTASELMTAWKGDDLTTHQRREVIQTLIECVTIRPRLTRRERHGPDMVRIIEKIVT